MANRLWIHHFSEFLDNGFYCFFSCTSGASQRISSKGPFSWPKHTRSYPNHNICWYIPNLLVLLHFCWSSSKFYLNNTTKINICFLQVHFRLFALQWCLKVQNQSLCFTRSTSTYRTYRSGTIGRCICILEKDTSAGWDDFVSILCCSHCSPFFLHSTYSWKRQMLFSRKNCTISSLSDQLLVDYTIVTSTKM